MASPHCRGLGPQRGTKPPKAALVPNEEPSCGTTARARLPSFSRALSLPLALGLSLIARPRGASLLLLRATICRASPALYLLLITARFVCAPRVASWGECGQCRWPLWPWLWLALDLPVGLCAVCARAPSVHVRPRGLVGERQL